MDSSPLAVARRVAGSASGAFIALFLLAALIRGAMFPVTPLDPRFTIRQENGAVAVELLRTGQYANPYVVASGPTAHPLPLYTGLLALLYHWFGISLLAEQIRYWLHVVSYSAMYAMLPWLGVNLGAGWRAGVAGGFIGAWFPVFPLTIGLGEELAAIALGLLMAAAARRWRSGGDSWGRCLLEGLGWGAAFHLAPALLLVFLAWTGFEAWRRRRWRPGAAMLLGVALACAPWTWRNHGALGEWFFVRSNFGLELRMGNYSGARSDLDSTLRGRPARHPRILESEAALVRDWGEMEYMRRARREALAWIADHPGEFLQLTAARVTQFWCGPIHAPWRFLGNSLLALLAALGAWRVLPRQEGWQRAAVLIPLAAYPLIYYLVPYQARYRLPVEGYLLLLAGAGLSEWWPEAGDA